MGKVIALRARANDARREAPPGGGAQILFFTGVRYMRMEEPLVAAADAPDSSAGAGKKRKRRARAIRRRFG